MTLANTACKRLNGLVVCCVFFGASLAHAQSVAPLYGGKIVLVDSGLITGPAVKALKSSADDAVRVLGKMTGQEYSVVSETGAVAGAIAEGIFLVPSVSSAAPADAVAKLKGTGREPFLIRSVDSRKLWIISNGAEGLGHGVYFFLEQLGVRWLMPGDAWEVIPPRQGIGIRLDTVVVPAYKMRNFAGTGGFGKALPVDPGAQIAARWARWKVRNRFGGEYLLGGHSGEAFNVEKKALLLEHPEYLAKVNGRHVSWSQIAKLNTANPEAVKLYVDWTVNRFRTMRKANPDAFAVSVEPSDGGGHCNSDACKQIGNGSPSDQVFYVANEAAKAVRAEFPDGWVNLYGYHEHAVPPSFPLEPNVYVAVIPYAFQTTGLAPEELIKAWSGKVRRMGIYNYWSIPDWSADLPSFDFVNTPREQLRLWQKNNIEGYTSESTFSGGAMGPGWYLASRLMWNPQADDAAILNEWFDASFGPARVPMRRMLERWARGFSLIGNEIALSHRDVAEARRLAQNDPAVLARLADYGRYVEYLRLRHGYDTAPPAAKSDALHQLVRHVWRIYHSGMIHSFRLFQLLARGNKEVTEGFPLDKASAPVWKELTPRSDAEVFAHLEAGARTLQPLDFSTRRYSGELVPVPKSLLPQSTVEVLPPMSFIGRVTLEASVPAGVRDLAFQLNSGPPTRVQLAGSDGVLLYDKPTNGAGGGAGAATAALETVRIPLSRAGRYRLTLTQEKNTAFSFAPPREAGVTLLPFTTSKGQASPPLYFFVPKGVKNVAIHELLGLPETLQPRLWTASGEEVKAQVHEGRTVLLYPVPAGQDGKVWKIARIVAPNGPIDILNAPATFAFSPDALLVFKDALQ
jgi:hypothetical protein